MPTNGEVNSTTSENGDQHTRPITITSADILAALVSSRYLNILALEMRHLSEFIMKLEVLLRLDLVGDLVIEGLTKTVGSAPSTDLTESLGDSEVSSGSADCCPDTGTTAYETGGVDATALLV